MKSEPRTNLISWEDLSASLEAREFKAGFRRADLDAPVELATQVIRRASAWFEEALEVEAELLWEGSHTFAQLGAAPLCLPSIFNDEYKPWEIQMLSDIAVDVGEKLVESEAPSLIGEELIALAIFEQAHAEVGDLENEGVIRDPLLAKRVHDQLNSIQIEAQGCSDAVPLLMGTSESLERDLALEVDPREIIREWFEDF